MDRETVLARLNPDHIRKMAHAAASHLAEEPCSFVVLTPGDATRYDIIITERTQWMTKSDDSDPRLVSLSGYIVTLVNLGGSYIWEGIKLHHDYVADKWCNDHEWTGIVLCEFLNALSDELGEP